MPAKTAAKTITIGSVVSVDLADALRHLADQHERSLAAEIRLALKTWVDGENARRVA
jgi:plasmid stability protein